MTDTPTIPRGMREKIKSKSHVNGDGCWVWDGHVQHWGRQYAYGMVWDSKNKKMILAHRASYEAFVGCASGKLVLHKCDNPSCVNPDHLFLGDQKLNVEDMISKGRGNKAIGEKHWKSRLTEKDVVDIRRSSDSLSVLMKRYSMSRSGIHAVRTGKLWRHV